MGAYDAHKKACKKKCVTAPLRNKDGSLAVEAIGKSELFANHLSSIFTSNTEHITNVFNSLDISLQLESRRLRLNRKRQLPIKKASDHDPIIFCIPRLKTSFRPGLAGYILYIYTRYSKQFRTNDSDLV